MFANVSFCFYIDEFNLNVKINAILVIIQLQHPFKKIDGFIRKILTLYFKITSLLYSIQSGSLKLNCMLIIKWPNDTVMGHHHTT